MAATARSGRDDTNRGQLGFGAGTVVQEWGYDDDVDPDLRAGVEAATGAELVDEDYADVTDGAILWWREDDGDVSDLADALVDAQANLDNGGLVWVLTPKAGRPGHVFPRDVEEAANTAGLHATSAAAAGPEWFGIRLAARPRTR